MTVLHCIAAGYCIRCANDAEPPQWLVMQFDQIVGIFPSLLGAYQWLAAKLDDSDVRWR